MAISLDVTSTEMLLDALGHEQCAECGVVLGAGNLAGVCFEGAYCNAVTCRFSLSDAIRSNNEGNMSK